MTPVNYPPNNCTNYGTHCPNCCDFSKGSLSRNLQGNQSAILFNQGNLHALARARVRALGGGLQDLQSGVDLVHPLEQFAKVSPHIVAELFFQIMLIHWVLVLREVFMR
jgi:hypothetical protein